MNSKEQGGVDQFVQQAESGLRQAAAHDAPEYAQLANAFDLNLPLLFCYDAKPAEDDGLVLIHDAPKDGGM